MLCVHQYSSNYTFKHHKLRKKLIQGMQLLGKNNLIACKFFLQGQMFEVI